jgi:hypothetical protein
MSQALTSGDAAARWGGGRGWIIFGVVVLLLLVAAGVLGWFVLLPWAVDQAFDFTAVEDLEHSSRSPEGTWEARTYYVNPGAMGSSSGRVDLVRISDGSVRELWSGPPLLEAPVWLDDSTLLVGEQRVSVAGPAADWSDAPAGGLSEPQPVVRQYVTALAGGDLPALQQASWPIVTRAMLPGLRREAFGARKRLEVLDVSLVRDPSFSASDMVQYDVALTVAGANGQRVLNLGALAVKEDGRWHVDWAMR